MDAHSSDATIIIIAFDSQAHVIQVHKLLNERLLSLFDSPCWREIYLPREVKAEPDLSFSAGQVLGNTP